MIVSSEIPSSGGREVTRVLVRNEESGQLRMDVEYVARFWTDLSNRDSMADRYVMRLCDVHLAPDDLAHLKSCLEQWIDAYREFECKIGTAESVVTFRVVTNEDSLIATKHKPAFGVTWDAYPSLHAQWTYLVDSTCVQMLLEGIKKL